MVHKPRLQARFLSDSVSSRVLRALRKSVSRRWGAFTLAELLVSVAVLAVLATVGFLALSGYSGDAKDAAAKANVRSVLSAVRAESALTGNSPRRYVAHDASLSGASLSGAFVEYDGNRTYLTGGDWSAPGTNYSAGNPDWAALKLDPAKFRIASTPRSPGFPADAFAAYDPKAVLLGAADAALPPSASGKLRTRTFLQAAAVLPSGTAFVVGDAPSFQTASGGSSGLVRDPSSPYLTGALVDSSPVSATTAGPLSVPVAPGTLSSSLRFDSSRSTYLTRTPSSAGNQYKWTWSAWVKRSKPGTYQNLLAAYNGNLSIYTYAYIGTDDTIGWSYNNLNWALSTKRVFRDPSAWYHIVLSFDSANPQADKRYRIFVNGVEETSFNTDNRASLQNQPSSINTASQHAIMANYNGTSPSDGYLSSIEFVDGSSLDASAFGQADPVSGSWMPTQYSGAYGQNGYRLDFSSWATAAWLWTDSAPITATGHTAPNNWTPSAGVALSDQVADTPVNNFATLNPLNPLNLLYGGYYAIAPVSGNLKITGSASPAGNSSLWTVAVSGKAYFEGQMTAVGAGTVQFGIRNLSTGATYVYDNSGSKILAGTSSAYGSSFTANDFVGVAVDSAARTLEFFKNGVSQGVIASAFPSGEHLPFFYASNGSSSTANFGQGWMAGLTYYADAGGYFKYAPPSGFKALSTANMPSPAVPNSKSQFDVLTYVGNGAPTPSAHTLSGLGFQPDFIWFKNRDSTTGHALMDGIRSWNKVLYSSSPNAESTEASSITFPTVGQFTIPASYWGAWNDETNKYVAWCWKGGGASVSNSDGTISSQVSANASAGFSIVTYAGTKTSDPGASATPSTIGHGLGSVPAMVLTKGRNVSNSWNVWHKSAQSGDSLQGYQLWLNLTNGRNLSGWQRGDTGMTESTFSPARHSYDDVSGTNYIAYVFAEVPGFSKFGSYTGNASSDGPFVHTGFRPKYVMVKRVDSAGPWVIYDSSRENGSRSFNELTANTSDQENSLSANISWSMDLLSNGFKEKSSSADTNYAYENASWGTYVYAAFAEAPFGGAGVAPATAR